MSTSFLILVHIFNRVRVTQSLVFRVVLCMSLFVLLYFIMANVFSVLWFTASHHLYGIFKLFNNFLKKYGFVDYSDFFFTCCNTFDRIL